MYFVCVRMEVAPDKLEAFTAPTANVELTKGVLNPGRMWAGV